MMSETTSAWQYTDVTKTVVVRTYQDGSMESCIATRQDVLDWIANGNSIKAPDTTTAS